MYKKILALDPSGNFVEGKGTTGYVILNHKYRILDYGELKASECDEAGQYWLQHKQLMDLWVKKGAGVVIEDYLLYAHKAEEQINSRFETSQLLGVLKQHAYESGCTLHFQKAQQVKRRWGDHILKYKGYIFQDGHKAFRFTHDGEFASRHVRDALRHALHFAHFKNKE